MNLINVYVEKRNTLKIFNSTFRYTNVRNLAPTNPIVGDVYYDETSSCLVCWTGIMWLRVSEGNGVSWS